MIIESSKLRELEVINLCDGKNLGCVSEYVIDTECGRVVAIIVSEHVFAFGNKNAKRIPWEKITCIGEDTILVDIGKGDGCACESEKDPKKGKKRPGWLF